MFDRELARYERKKKRRNTGIQTAIGILAVAAAIFFISYISGYSIEGNYYIEDEKIIDEMFSSRMNQRFFYMLFRNAAGIKEQVDGIADYRMDFSLDFSVTVTVTENEIIGAAESDSSLYYFDKYGFVMAKDISLDFTVPTINGLAFNGVGLYNKLESKEEGLIDGVIQLTQLLADNGISADSIYYDEDSEASIKLGDVEVTLGSRDYMADKLIELKAIIDSGKLEGLKGVLHLDNYGESNTDTFIFERQ